MTIIETRSKQSYVGAGIILVRGDKYLLLKGRSTGVWSFSKGHPEVPDNETPLRTAVRETYEETGLVAGVHYSIVGDSIRFGKRPYWVGVMKEPYAQVVVCRKEHSMAAWFTWEEITTLNSNTDVRQWIKKSRSPNGEFTRLTSCSRQETHSTV